MPEAVPGRVDVSVVVVARGAEPGLPETLRGVLASLDVAARGPAGSAGAGAVAPAVRLRGHRLGGEVVLVVGDVAALPPGLGGDRRVRVVAAPGVGPARARNLGVAASRGRYLLFTLAEVRVPAAWVSALTAPLRAGRADLVAGAVHPPGRAPSAARADRLLGVVADPPPPGAWPAAAGAATRAVLESVGFDEGLRADEEGAAVVFRRDAVGAGFREAPVAGQPVLLARDPARAGRRAVAARARARGRVDAYVARHLGRGAPALLPAVVAVVRHGLAVLLLTAGRAPAERLLPARAARARATALLRLRRAPDRVAPRSAAGDVPGGAGAPRAASPVALVTRPPARAEEARLGPVVPRVVPVVPARGPRGTAGDFWGRGRGGRAAPAALPDRTAS
ncbi:MAG: glycosyltransferase [Micrococcales bacterium]|nr:glycosyltransferase [Micrococcales bacterium]